MRNSAKSFPVGRSAALVTAMLLAACGGGGGGGASTAPGTPTSTASAPAPVVLSDATPQAPAACRKAAAAAPRRTVPGIGLGEPELDADTLGMWSPVVDFPLIPVHAALTPDGRVMSYGTTREGKQTARLNYAVWDPSLGTGADAHLSLPNTTSTDIFCSGQILMPQSGRLLLTGGDNYVNGATQNIGVADTTVFDPATNQLAQGNPMLRSRWYGTPAMTHTGEVLLMGGQVNPALPTVADVAEIRRADGTFRALPNVDTTRFNYWYPRAFTARDGRMFGYENSGGMFFIDPTGDGRLSPMGNVALHPTGHTASVASFAPGKMLVAGGTTTETATIEFDGPLPIVRRAAPLSSVREYVNLTTLADGRIVATGGSALANELAGVVYSADIWSPQTGQWTRAASATRPRLYHSMALMLPDASVMVGGGGAPGPVTNTNAEIFYPPYLFEAGGKWAVRPRIVSAPTVLDPGATLPLTVESTRPVARVTFVKMGSVTHSINFDQRFVELPFTTSGRQVSATLPANSGDVSPGFWMAFVIDDRGVPSIAAIVRVNALDAPLVDTGWSQSFGGVMRVDGTRFAATCAADEAMVGVRGGAGGMVGSVQPMCVRVDGAGRWVGTPVPRGVAGGPGTGTPYERLCPAGSAVSGLQGRADWGINQMTVSCSPLGADRTVGTTSTALQPAGWPGGNAQSPVACAGGRAATGLYGLHGAQQVHTVGLVCGAPVVDPRTVPDTPLTIPLPNGVVPPAPPVAPAPATPATPAPAAPAAC
jgi:hypothetical protein